MAMIVLNIDMTAEGDAAVARVGKKAAGRLLDGVLHDKYPDDKT